MTSSLVGSEMCIRDSTSPPTSSTSALYDSDRGRENTVVLTRVPKVDAQTVSYTHLTLPTICSV
eukprot:12842479-Prorocentrum_lima.AAC.1